MRIECSTGQDLEALSIPCVVSRIMTPLQTHTHHLHILIPETVTYIKYVKIHGKGELRLHMELRLLISRPQGEILLEYMGGPYVITRFLKRIRGRCD